LGLKWQNQPSEKDVLCLSSFSLEQL